MAEEIAADAAEKETEQNHPAGGSAPKTFTAAELDAEVKRRIDKQNVKHAGELDEINSRLKELEDKLAAEEAKAERLQLEHDLNEWKAKASTDTGVPANLLRGSSEQEIQEHAEQLKAALSTLPHTGDQGTPTAPKAMTKEAIAAISDDKERRAAIAANIDLWK